jgi:hypothetical protein
MAVTVRVHLRENVEKEWLDVVVQGLVVQEQLGQQAQALAVPAPRHTYQYQYHKP